MAAMPAEHSGLLAEATKFTGELSCEPLVGDVTVTTGVVAKARLEIAVSVRTSKRADEKRPRFTAVPLGSSL